VLLVGTKTPPLRRSMECWGGLSPLEVRQSFPPLEVYGRGLLSSPVSSKYCFVSHRHPWKFTLVLETTGSFATGVRIFSGATGSEIIKSGCTASDCLFFMISWLVSTFSHSVTLVFCFQCLFWAAVVFVEG